jgi:hypothetical protein
VYGELHSSYRQLRDCPNFPLFLAKTVSLVSLCGPETAIARLYWLERSCHDFGSRVDAQLHFIESLGSSERAVLAVIDAEVAKLAEGGDKLNKGFVMHYRASSDNFSQVQSAGLLGPGNVKKSSFIFSGLASLIRDKVLYNYPRLVSFCTHFFAFGLEMVNYYIDLFRDSVIVLGIVFMSEIRDGIHEHIHYH